MFKRVPLDRAWHASITFQNNIFKHETRRAVDHVRTIRRHEAICAVAHSTRILSILCCDGRLLAVLMAEPSCTYKCSRHFGQLHLELQPDRTREELCEVGW